MTLTCVYAACWEPTKNSGVRDVANHYPVPAHEVDVFPESKAASAGYDLSPKAIAPLLLKDESLVLRRREWSTRIDEKHPWGFIIRRRYYFWFFGYVVQLPCEQNRLVATPDRPATGG